MKKVLLLVILSFVLLLSSCKNTDKEKEDVIPPVIEGTLDMELEKNTEFNLLDGVTAIDLVDGDVTDLITYTVRDKDGNIIEFDSKIFGMYYITYIVKDLSNNLSAVTRLIHISSESDEPYIEGVEDLVIGTASKYDPADDLYASDEIDGDLTYAVIINYYFNGEEVFNLDYSVEGFYTFEYIVTNSRGITATKTITVEIR
jgi:hypothetical protein